MAFNLDREISIRENVDAKGKKWEIKHIRGTALYVAVSDPESNSTPEEFEGRWTKPATLQEQITTYLNRSWDAAELAAKKNAAAKRTAAKKEEE